MDEPGSTNVVVSTSIFNVGQTLVRKVAEWEQAPLRQWQRLGSVHWWWGKGRFWCYAPPKADVRKSPLPNLSVGLQLEVAGQEWEDIPALPGGERERGKPMKLALRVALFPKAAELTEVRMECFEPEGKPFLERIQAELEPIKKRMASQPKGAHGDTLSRVKDARKLIEGGMPKTAACKRAHTDPRTYDRHIADVLDWKDDYLKAELA